MRISPWPCAVADWLFCSARLSLDHALSAVRSVAHRLSLTGPGGHSLGQPLLLVSLDCVIGLWPPSSGSVPLC